MDFWGEGKNGVPGEKLLRTRVKIHDKLKSHMALLRIHTQVTFNRGSQTLTKNMPSQPPNIDNKESLHGVHWREILVLTPYTLNLLWRNEANFRMCFSRWALCRCIFLGDLAYMWRRNRDLFPVIASLHLKSNVCEPGPPKDFCDVQCRRRSRINTDWFPTSRKVWGHAPLGHFLHFNAPNSPFLGFWLIQTVFFTDCPNHFPDFNMESFKFLKKNTFIMKNLTDWRKTVELPAKRICNMIFNFQSPD